MERERAAFLAAYHTKLPPHLSAEWLAEAAGGGPAAAGVTPAGAAAGAGAAPAIGVSIMRR